MAKKILIVLLVLCMVIPMVACQNETDGSTPSDTAQETEVVVVDPEEEYLNNLPVRDYEQSEFNILVTTALEPYYKAEYESTDFVENAAYERNLEVEEKYGVIINYTPFKGEQADSAPLVTAIRTSMTGEPFDLVMAQVQYLMPLSTEGMFHNVINNEFLHYDEAWYHSDINKNAKLGYYQYCFSGDFILSQTAHSMGIYVNKGMYEDLGYTESVYDLVDNKQWTFEKMNTLITDVYYDTDGQGEVDNTDRFGLVSVFQITSSLMAGMGHNIVTFDAEGLPTIENYYNDHLISLFEKMLNFMEKQDVWWEAPNDPAANMFLNNQALFANQQLVISTMDEYRESDLDFCILPLPLYDEKQESYQTTVARSEMMFIPSNADAEKSGIVTEYLMYSTYKNVLPQYWEITLKMRNSDNEDELRMLEIQHAGVRFDFVNIYSYTLGGLDTLAYELALKRKNELSSQWGNKKGIYEEALEFLIADYTAISEE